MIKEWLERIAKKAAHAEHAAMIAYAGSESLEVHWIMWHLSVMLAVVGLIAFLSELVLKE